MTYTAYQPSKQTELIAPYSQTNTYLIVKDNLAKQDDNLTSPVDLLAQVIDDFRKAFSLTNNKTTSNSKRQPINSIISQLKNNYLLDVNNDIIDYLQEKPHLISILIELLPVTAGYFKSDKLYLTIIKDPESYTLDKISIVVNTHLNVTTAFAKLQELDDFCFQARIPSDILVHVEFF